MDPDRMWVVVAATYDGVRWNQRTTTDYNDMRKLFAWADVLVGHNIILWDIPVIERVLDIKIKSKFIDTLALSWYLYPERKIHGLEEWGEQFGIPKPPIIEWNDPSMIDEYIHRCQEDVKITCSLYDMQMEKLDRIYDDSDAVDRLVKYIMFKMDCAAQAEESGWKLDVELTESSLAILELEKESKVQELIAIMPDVVKYGEMRKPKSLYLSPKVHSKPKTFQKKDGTLSSSGRRFKAICDSVGHDCYTTNMVTVQSRELTAQGLKWVDLLIANNLPENHSQPITFVASTSGPNPNSPAQVKDFLFANGWEPITFDHKRKVDAEGKDYIDKIPQVRVEVDGVKQLCPSVRKLFKAQPRLVVLEGLSILTHRIGILNGFMSSVDENGYIKAQIQGLTNTLRFKHKTVVNLPNVKKPYGKIVRGVLIAPEGYELCGSDMSSLEDRTKQHYMWDFDPEYVKEMQVENFDPHLALAEFAVALTPEQVLAHKSKEEDHGVIRHQYKTANYSCTYKVGAKTLSITLDVSQERAQEIIDAYWKRNWSIIEIEKIQTIKIFYKDKGRLTFKIFKGSELMPLETDTWKEKRVKSKMVNMAEEMWLFNPVSKFWYSLRYIKDIFSTLNQGTGVFCFDIWIGNFMARRRQLTGQMHDEVILCVHKGKREAAKGLLRDAMAKTNRQLKLNRELDIDVQFGLTYADIH